MSISCFSETFNQLLEPPRLIPILDQELFEFKRNSKGRRRSASHRNHVMLRTKKERMKMLKNWNYLRTRRATERPESRPERRSKPRTRNMATQLALRT
jgi:hypothetical protein